MADKPLPWFRLYHEAATDPKFDVVSMTTGIEWCTVFGAWTKILCIAASSPIRGALYVTFQKRFSNANVTAMLRLSSEQSSAIMQAFLDCDMLELDEQGAYRVKNWNKRQYDSDNSTKRVQEHRKRKDETLQKQHGNVSETMHSVSVSDSSSSDNTVDLSTSINKEDGEKKEIDEESAIGKLSKQFEASANMPAHNLEKWNTALQEMHQAGARPEDIAEVVHTMKCPPKGGKKLTVAGPWSCTNMVIAHIADKGSNGNGSLGIDRSQYV